MINLSQWSSTRESRRDFVPPAKARFAELPAQVDLAAVLPAREVNQAGEGVLQLDAELAQLGEAIFQPRAVMLPGGLFLFELRVGDDALGDAAALEPLQPLVPVADAGSEVRNVLDDRAHQRQHRLGLL